jgi:hypothetical protein
MEKEHWVTCPPITLKKSEQVFTSCFHHFRQNLQATFGVKALREIAHKPNPWLFFPPRI